MADPEGFIDILSAEVEEEKEKGSGRNKEVEVAGTKAMEEVEVVEEDDDGA